MVGYHSPQVDVAVRLNTNESPFPPPEGWVESLAEVSRSIAWNRYPDRSAHELRDVIARRHGVRPENVFVANGSNEVLQTILLTYGGHGRTVATFEPTYQMYAQIARVTGATVVTGDRHSDFTIDVQQIDAVMSHHAPSVSFLCNPNNPTGLVEPKKNLDAMLERATGIVVVDEAYAEFADWSAVDMVDETRPLIVTRTFSKTLSLAALRVGYAIGPTWAIEKLQIAVLPYHLDAFKQAATIAALSYTNEMEQRVAVIKKERARIEEGLSRCGMTVWPSGANFILFRTPESTGASWWQQLLDRGILVRDCSSWPRLERCLRVTVGTEAENTAFLDAVSAIAAAG
ncbi:MAG: histidinol-phosphate aminotransferase [Actinomycetota bacterium]